MSSFVAVPAQDIEQFLQSRGFARTVQRNEVVYVRASKRDVNVLLKVYTSIHDGRETVRAVGRDAIRVCVIFDDRRGKTFGIGKFNPVLRVHSVQSVLARLLERIQQAATRGNEWLDQQTAWQERRVQEKAEYARQERTEEETGFRSDPDFQDEPGHVQEMGFDYEAMIRENIRQGKCPDGCCG